MNDKLTEYQMDAATSLISKCCHAPVNEYGHCADCKDTCDIFMEEDDHADCHNSPEDGCTHESHRIPVQDMNEPTTVMGAFAKVQESVEELQDILNRDPLKALKYNNFPF